MIIRVCPQAESIQDLQLAVTKYLVLPYLELEASLGPSVEEVALCFPRFERFIDALGVLNLQKFQSRLRDAALGILTAIRDGKIASLSESFFTEMTPLEIEPDWFDSSPGFWKDGVKDKDFPTVVLHGPPGTGKSTLVKMLQASSNVDAIDAEVFGNTLDEIKSKFLNFHTERSKSLKVYGSAHMFAEFGSGAYRILLLPPLPVYIERFERRNELNPDKKWQGEMRSWSKWNGRRDRLDFVLQNDGSPDDTLRQVLSIIDVIRMK
ncbi:MAG: hypothetical protein KDD62_05980, partial [Bdellovibrionales bacterium]|nr:hypothetical protein [Bdellovibrionales bacterium]